MGIICLTPQQEQKLRESHESFRCPMGHTQGFYGDTKNEKEIKRLKHLLSLKDNMLQYRQDRIDELQAELRSTRARLGAKTRKLRAVA